MKTLVLFRGLPGSGKSTLSGQLCDVTLSADDYFIQPDGSYQFSSSDIKDAHAQCQSNTTTAMRLGIQRIGVANTFTRDWEMQPYFDLADEYGYQIHTVVVENRHDSKNAHGVPFEAIAAMKNRFEVKLMDRKSEIISELQLEEWGNSLQNCELADMYMDAENHGNTHTIDLIDELIEFMSQWDADQVGYEIANTHQANGDYGW